MGIPLPALDARAPAPPENPLDAYSRMMQIKGAQQQQQIGQMQIQQQKRQDQYEQNLQNLWSKPTAPTDQDILQAGGPRYGPQILKSRLDIQKTKGDLQEITDKHQAAVADHLGNLANAIKTNGYDPGKTDTLLAGEATNPDQQWAAQVAQIRQNFAQNPQLIKTVADNILAQSPKQQELKNQALTAQSRGGFTGVDANGNPVHMVPSTDATGNPTAIPVAPAFERNAVPKSTKEQLQAQLIAQENKGDTAGTAKTKQQLKDIDPLAQQRLAITVNSPGGKLTDDAVDNAAEQYYRTGQIPRIYGRSGGQVQTQIMNRAGELHPGAALAVNSAEYKANQGSLSAITRQRDTVFAFENTAGKNLDLFLEKAQPIVDSGSPWINTPIRLLSEKLAGSTNMAAINAARTVAMTEIAKVVNNPGLAGQLSDSARHEVESLSPQNATLPQIVEVAKVLRTDMSNRKIAYDQQISDIQGRLRQAPTSGNAGAAQAPPSAPSAGMTRIQASDGSLHDIPSANLGLARKIDPKLQVVK